MSGVSDRRELFDAASELAFRYGDDDGLVEVFPPRLLDEAWCGKDDVEFERWTVERLVAFLFSTSLSETVKHTDEKAA